MNKVRTLTLCFTAALAFAAFGGASAAYAKEKLPAWGKCEQSATHEGKYSDRLRSACQEGLREIQRRL